MRKLRFAVILAAMLLIAGCTEDKVPVCFPESCDIVVIGGGGAGLTAANVANGLGCKVILLDKSDGVGGNTINATGGINACNTRYQKKLGIADSEQLFFDDTMKGGHYLNDPALVWTLVRESSGTVDYLSGLGLDLGDVGFMAGSSVPRTHRPSAGYIGPTLVSTLDNSLLSANVDVRVKCKVVDIEKEDGAVSGVVYENDGKKYVIRTRAVIVASGGFSANHEMVVKYGGQKFAGFGTTNKPCATGDAFAWVEKFDAALVQMDQIQIHPTVLESGFMISESVRGNGAILVNSSGLRFCSEMETRDVVSKAVTEQDGGCAYLIFDQATYDSLPAIAYYDSRGFLKSGATVEALAASLGLPEGALASTMARYADMQQKGEDVDFQRAPNTMLLPLTKPPFYGVRVIPAIHHTMGGLKIDTSAHVIDNSGNIIKGLYAAGEVTGGVHGGNRLGGNSLTDITTFGRIAAQTAAAELKGN